MQLQAGIRVAGRDVEREQGRDGDARVELGGVLVAGQVDAVAVGGELPPTRVIGVLVGVPEGLRLVLVVGDAHLDYALGGSRGLGAGNVRPL